MKPRRTIIVRWLTGIYLVLFIGLACYDAAPDPAIAEFLKVPASTVSDADNGYFALLGFSAPAGSDMHAYGRSSFRTALEKAAQARAQGNQPPPQRAAGKQLTFLGKDVPKENLYTFATGTPEQLVRLANDNRELLERYKRLTSYRHVVEPMVQGQSLDQPIPAFAPVRSTQALALTLLVRQASQGHVDEALAALETDLGFWRATLHQGHMLITKLIAIACLQRDYQVLSELIGHTSLTQSQRLHLSALLPPWQPGDIAFDEALRYEALYLTDALFSSLPQQRPLDRLLLKKNATRNVVIRSQMVIARQASLSADRFYAQLDAVEAERHQDTRLGLDLLYNPIGAILTSIAVPNYSTYCARGHELEAKRRMVLLHLKAREQGIGPEGMAAFLKQAGKEYANPYTGQPMQWDVKKKAIVMDSLSAKGKAEQRRVELAL